MIMSNNRANCIIVLYILESFKFFFTHSQFQNHAIIVIVIVISHKSYGYIYIYIYLSQCTINLFNLMHSLYTSLYINVYSNVKTAMYL